MVNTIILDEVKVNGVTYLKIPQGSTICTGCVSDPEGDLCHVFTQCSGAIYIKEPLSHLLKRL